ncbi:putative transcription factor cys6 protein [Botrytis fragariae]|uniref:Putative transcription factor cys6 protein n=1 Tax=Botrytis fragariae TaxID=1964551 RepID=A0A8H6EM04_9HELO|nr:putative transcription factor cys6 protein [Botrytis fragariae]KAF5877158.1 putative transcription factor cys6 protein [Botrytis fragariae]
MPGVPSGRGCEACRKQKKKCDQVKPSCSRCIRLSIPCIGSGIRRYKFISGSIDSTVTTSSTTTNHNNHALHTTRKQILRMPGNKDISVAGSFISVLEVKDIRYDIGVYGAFLTEIPKRLGSSAALDASVNAISTSYTSIYSRTKPVEALESYGRGLKALRVALNDPKEATEANTICAFYLMMICQTWMAHGDDNANHGEILVYLLNAAAAQNWQGTFEAELLVTLCVPLIMEGIRNPKVKWTPVIGKLTEARDNAIRIESLKLQTLAKVPEYLRYPQQYFLEIESTYAQMKIDLSTMRNSLDKLRQAPHTRTLHSRFQAAYSLILSFANLLNSLLRVFSNDLPSLIPESVCYVEETIVLAEEALEYRPLGSSAMPMVLTTAWVATSDMSRRIRIENLLIEYQSDFAIMNWMEVALWLEQRLRDIHLSFQDFGATTPLMVS